MRYGRGVTEMTQWDNRVGEKWADLRFLGDDPEGWSREGGGFRMGNTCIPVADAC